MHENIPAYGYLCFNFHRRVHRFIEKPAVTIRIHTHETLMLFECLQHCLGSACVVVYPCRHCGQTGRDMGVVGRHVQELWGCWNRVDGGNAE